MPHTSLEDFPLQVADRLRKHQHRVLRVIARLDAHGWLTRLDASDRDRLITVGHFEEYGAELDWGPREVVGHLVDSALVFHDRLVRLRSEANPLLPDFVTTDPERVRGYNVTPLDKLVDTFATAQRRIYELVRAVPHQLLDIEGIHEVDGPVTVGDLLSFLPDHQRDHAEQMEVLLRRASPDVPLP